MEKHMGPYRATKLWNDVIRTFRQGMPVSRHRRYMKSYDDSFTPTEAIDWLHAQLQVNPNFGPSVSRSQTLQLLEKFQKARVFEDVRGVKYQDTIAENGRLYRFTMMSPVKSRTPVRPARTPLAVRATSNTTGAALVAPPTAKLDFDKEVKTAAVPPPSGDGCQQQSTQLNTQAQKFLKKPSKLTREEVEDVWKNLTLASLQKALKLPSLSHILDSDFVNAQYIAHNMTHVNKNGVVCNIDKDDQLPYWVLSAMRCLAHWPNKVEGNLPDYPGFEKDVFKVVKDYFEGLDEPLLTFSMYEVFSNAFVYAENMGRPRAATAIPTMSQQPHNMAYYQTSTIPGGITSFASVENLLMDLTMNGTMMEETEGELDEHLDAVLGGEEFDVDNLNTAFHPAMDKEQKMWGVASVGARSCDPRVKGARPCLRRSITSHDLRSASSHHDLRTHQYDSDHQYASRDDIAVESAAMRRYPSATSMPMHITSAGNGNRLETSFGVDNAEEPRTHVWTGYSNPGYYSGRELQQQQNLHQSQQSLYDRSRYVSMMSIEGRYGEEESFLQQEQKCLSTNDVSRMPPYPENGLSRNHQNQRNTSRGSYSSLIDGSNKNNNSNKDDIYGYTVVVATTPKSERNVWPKHRSASHIQQYKEAQQISNSTNHYENVYSDHDYHRRPQHEPSWKAAPPPYIPPPSYQQFHQRAPSEHSNSSSSSSYVTAPSHQSSVNSTQDYQLKPDQVYLDHEPRGVHSPQCKDRVIEALRVCCLLLPPPNRRKLHLLLRLMVKMSENPELKMDDSCTTRNLVHRTFTRCILRSTEEADFDEILSLRLVSFMMDNYAEIMKIPEELKSQIEDRISHLRKSKVTAEQFEKQKLTNSQLALDQLLEGIINDKVMAEKDKKRRLKQFQKSHPDIYARHFPMDMTIVEQPKKPRIKPALLRRPLQKLKSFRM